MKSFFFTLFLLAGIAYNGVSQNMASALQSNKWHVRGELDGKKMILSSKVATSADWEAKFAPTGMLSYCYTTKSTVIDATGMEIKPNTYYCDDFNNYEVKNNVIQIKHLDKVYYYNIKALDNKEGYELNPATAADFK
jgi:hypothetical protein